MTFFYRGSLKFVFILSLLSSYVVGLPKQLIASPQPQVLQVAQANTPKKDIKVVMQSNV